MAVIPAVAMAGDNSDVYTIYDGSFRGPNLLGTASFGESSAATARTEPFSNEMENHYLIIAMVETENGGG